MDLNFRGLFKSVVNINVGISPTIISQKHATISSFVTRFDTILKVHDKNLKKKLNHLNILKLISTVVVYE